MPIATRNSEEDPISIPVLRSIDWTQNYRALLDPTLYTVHSDVMSTIGHPLYLSKSVEQYYSTAMKDNVWLFGQFGGLLNAFIETLESSLGRTILFDPRLAVPGFHRFSIERRASYPGGVWHVDEFQFQILPPPISCYSATLLLGDEYESYGIEYKSGGSERYFQHKIGFISLFPSQLLHRIGDCGTSDVARCRITLQAHIWVYSQQAVAFW